MISILFGGPASSGIRFAANVLSEILHDYGYYVFNYRDYSSLIEGGHNFNVVSFDEKPIYSHENKFDILVAIDERTLKVHEKNLKKDGVIVDANLLGLKEDKNLYLLAYVCKLLGLSEKELNKYLKAKLNKTINLKVEIEPIFKVKKHKRKGVLIDGTEGVGKGALASGLNLYIAYPMTPATPLMNFLADKVKVVQLENEIAVANAALGASYAGARVMIGTSGGGFALMGEAMSLQGMSETPLVAYLAMRMGPSTGVPTYTSQGDMQFALHIGHGEFPRVVVAPGDPAEAFRLTQEAFYLAHKFQVLSIVLSDKHLAECQYTISLPKKIKVPDFIVEANQNYKRYKITKNGISPRAIPGGKGVVKATSYEHDEFGITTENAEKVKAMVEKRLRKWKSLNEEVKKKFEMYATYGKGNNLIVSWGSTKGAILDAMKKLKGWKFLQIKYLAPFPKDIVKILKRAKRVVLIENDATGMLADLIREKTGFEIKEKLLKYDARPFTAEDILEGLK